MSYIIYHDAALKHLHNCETLLSQIGKTLNDSYVYNAIYYLSGYICECIINYAIYHYVPWRTDSVYSLVSPQVCFSYDSVIKPQFIIKSHKYRINIQYLYLHNPSLQYDIDKLIRDYNVNMIFSRWNTASRYEVIPKFNSQNEAKNYVQFCHDLYLTIMYAL